MTNFSTDSISAFMGIGKRYTVDIKLHGMGISTNLVQIDEVSLEDFMDRWESSIDDTIRTVNAFFGECIKVESKTLLIGCSGGRYLSTPEAHKLLDKDNTALHNLRYALDDSYEYRCEMFQAIAEFVRSVNVVSSRFLD